MAKIKFGLVVTDARGKAGGMVYSKNRSGAYLRTKVTPVNPNTQRQATVRNNLTQNSKAWSNILSDGQRASYQALADNNPVTNIFGDTQILTGIALFGKINNVMRNLELPTLNDPPANLDVTGLASMLATASLATQAIDIAFTDTPLPAGHRLYIFATGNIAGGVNFFKPRLRYIGSSAAAEISPFDAGSLWVAKFGALALGAHFGIAIAVVNEVNGAITVALQQKVTVGA